MAEPSHLKELLRECATARRARKPEQCREAARNALKVDPYSIRAHRNVCWSLFALRSYTECRQACRDAADMIGRLESLELSKESKTYSLSERKKERFLLRRVQHASLMCERMLERDADRDDTVTHRLQNGWYRNHLLEKIASEKIQPFTPEPGPHDRVPTYVPYPVGENDCCIMQVLGGRVMWQQTWIAGGERTLAIEDFMLGFPLDQATGGVIYRKNRIFPFQCRRDECYRDGRGLCQMCFRKQFPMPTHPFPEWSPKPEVDCAAIVSPNEGRKLDAFYGTNLVPHHVHTVLRDRLDTLRERRKDFPIPKYQNIIDPNIGAVNDLWVPTEFEVTEVESATDDMLLSIELLGYNATNGIYLPPGVAQSIATYAGDFPVRGKAKICSKIPDLDPHSYAALYSVIKQVFEASIPLLAKLRHPSLLLPGPVQAVVKAQRIYVTEQEPYTGVWHEDGMHEDVVAVVLYYYRASECLEGGNMEIASKETTVIGFGDWGGNPSPEEYLEQLARVKVPIQEGTLLVFSNFAAVHRVLPMICKPGGKVGYRDFLAFFVIDQRSALPLPMELGPVDARKSRRYELLQQQLTPRGNFGLCSDDVYSTGNGTPYDLGWIRGRNSSAERADDSLVRLVGQMNMPPLVMGRGVSGQQAQEAEDESYETNPLSTWCKHIIHHNGTTRAVWANLETFEMTTGPLNEGACDIRMFFSTGEWLAYTQEHGFFWREDENHAASSAPDSQPQHR